MNYSQWLSIILIFIVGHNNNWACATLNPSSSHFFNRKLLRQMKSYIDVEANPCANFYQYACGKWSQVHAVCDNPESPYTTAIDKVNYEINLEYVQYLDAMIIRNKPEFAQKAHAFYKSCLSAGLNKDNNLKNVIRIMQGNANMKWALLGQTPFDWVRTLAVLRRYGLNGIWIEEDVYDSYGDTFKSVIDLDKPTQGGGFTPMTYEDLKYITESLGKTLNAVEPARQLSDRIVKFEVQLRQLELVKDHVGLKQVAVKDLPLPWLQQYLSIVLNRSPLNPNMKVQIQNVAYMKELDALLQSQESGFLCRYLELRFLWQLGQTPKTSNKTNCVAATRGFQSLAMNWIYEQEHPELEQEIPRIYEIFNNIVAYIRHKMKADRSGIVTPKVLNKLDKIKLKVGNLPRINTIEVLNSFYAALSLSPHDFYGNLLNISHFYFNVSHSGYGNYLSHNVDELFYADSYVTGSTFLPYYLNTPNVMMAPLTLMRQPFYHWGYGDVFTYSTLGNRFAILIIKDLMETCAVEAENLQKLVEISGFHSAYGAFRSQLPEDQRDAYFARGAQIIFFLNSAQILCDAAAAFDVNPFMTHFPEFSDVFDCKLRHFLKAFEKLQEEKEEL
uniref:Peptidase M13 N-terminal domain-containing protein n=1 Tax=Stomoxys calcitrans TaxID=35570 RepID=A0A1I8Q421_STOCA